MPPEKNQPVCFTTGLAQRFVPSTVANRLDDRSALALAELLQILCCGEESAIFAFTRLSRDSRLETSAQEALATIAAEEAVHEEYLGNLRFSLPAPADDEALRTLLKRFFRSLGSRHLGIHFAQLAALDSGVCAILAALRRNGRPIAREENVSGILGRIHRDEARHTASATFFARHFLPSSAIVEEAVETRRRLVEVVMHRADAMENLGVDPEQLSRRLRTLPAAFAC